MMDIPTHKKVLMNRRPSLLRILTVDYPCFVALMVPVILVVLSLAGLFFTLDVNVWNDLKSILISAAILLVALVVLAWRVQLFNAVFDDSIQAVATISRVSFYRDRGHIGYVYSYQGQKFNGGSVVMRMKRTRALQPGQQVVVMVDRNRPKRAFIRDLYL